jgi:hypothetical protein
MGLKQAQRLTHNLAGRLVLTGPELLVDEWKRSLKIEPDDH